MTTKEFTHLRGFLEGKQTELERLLRNREALAVNSSADPTDQIQHAAERDMAIGNLERESTRLREVHIALRRISLGTFGICLQCEEQISIKRLNAVPWTTFCLECREAMDGDPVQMPTTPEELLLETA